jgi:hypothetical protein
LDTKNGFIKMGLGTTTGFGVVVGGVFIFVLYVKNIKN